MTFKCLGIETSCDETAIAVVDEERRIISENILSQDHTKFKGVVPELASRSHLEYIDTMIRDCLKKGNVDLENLDLISVTGGPGLIGGLIVGVVTAKAIAHVTKTPFIAVNHLEGHLLTARLSNNIEFPFLCILMSGGHCQIIFAKELGDYQILGQTIDDSIGESFDKVSTMLDFEYPGGPIVENLALKGDESRFTFPRCLQKQKNCNFSFSGLKTSVRNQIISMKENITYQDKCDIAASFQECVSDIIQDRLQRALGIVKNDLGIPNIDVVLGGGVAANKKIRNDTNKICEDHGSNLYCPPIALCTDNAAMIAWTGIERFKIGNQSKLDFDPRSRWPITEISYPL